MLVARWFFYRLENHSLTFFNVQKRLRQIRALMTNKSKNWTFYRRIIKSICFQKNLYFLARLIRVISRPRQVDVWERYYLLRCNCKRLRPDTANPPQFTIATGQMREFTTCRDAGVAEYISRPGYICQTAIAYRRTGEETAFPPQRLRRRCLTVSNTCRHDTSQWRCRPRSTCGGYAFTMHGV